MREFFKRIHLARGLSVYRTHDSWFIDLWEGGKRVRKSLGTNDLASALLAVMRGNAAVWPPGTPCAGLPLINDVRLWVDGVQIQPVQSPELLAQFLQQRTGVVQAPPPVRPSETPENAHTAYSKHLLGAQMGKSWRKNNDSQIRLFREWLAANTKAVTMLDISPAVLSAYRAYLRAELKSGDDSVKQKLTILRRWFRWCMETHGWMSADPTKGLIDRVRRADPIVYQVAGVMSILDAARKRGTLWQLLFALAVYCGLRREELYRLKWEHLQKDLGLIRVANLSDDPTKTHSGRRVPIFDEIASILEDVGWQAEGRVFEWLGHPDSMSGGISEICRDAGVTAGDRDGLQYARHTAASAWLRLGIPASIARNWLGHVGSLDTLEKHYLGLLTKPLPIHWKGVLIGRDNVPSV